MLTIPERKIYTIAEISRAIKNTLEGQFGSLWVQGEISNFAAPRSGHYYFTLKDAAAQLRAVCFRSQGANLRFQPADGLEVIARGRLTTYEPRGEYQMIVETMEPLGAGALQLAFEQRKEKLRKLGLFDEARKRPLPLLPRKIGVVTSPTGAAIQDILRILGRRHSGLHVLIYPAKVQGDGAAEEIATGIHHLNTRADIDVIIAGRGGGSMEDLWPFNEEVVAHAIYESRIPVISAVGHEVDYTIADFVADRRAPTPSAAAELVSGVRSELQDRVEQGRARLRKGMLLLIARRRSRWQTVSSRRAFSGWPDRIPLHRQRLDDGERRLAVALKNKVARARDAWLRRAERLARFDPARAVRERREHLQQVTQGLARAMERRVAQGRQGLAMRAGLLDTLSPLAVLGRGYAICRTAAGDVLRRADQVAPGDHATVDVAEARLECEVKAVQARDGKH